MGEKCELVTLKRNESLWREMSQNEFFSNISSWNFDHFFKRNFNFFQDPFSDWFEMEIFQKISGLTPSQMVFVYSYLFKTAYNRLPPNRLKTGFMESYDLRKVSYSKNSSDWITSQFCKFIYYSNYSSNRFFLETIYFMDAIYH